MISKTAKLLEIAYAAHKKGLKSAAQLIFSYAMDDKEAEALIQEITKTAEKYEAELEEKAAQPETQPEPEKQPEGCLGEEDEEIEIDVDIPEEAPAAQEPTETTPAPTTEPVISDVQSKKLKALANKIAAAEGGKHRDLAKKLLAVLK